MHPTDTARLADEIAELAAHLDAATSRFLTLIAHFDEAGGWAEQGALTCAHWLSWRVGLDLGAAREHVRVARALRDLPALGAAMERGAVSYSKVRALTRVATVENEGALLEMARTSTASQLERICRGYRLAIRNATGARPEDEVETRWVRERETATGFVRFEAQLTPDEAAVLRRALEVAADRAWRTGGVSAGTRTGELKRADALVAVAERFLAGGTQSNEGDAAPPVEIVVHVENDAASGGTLDDGTALPPATAERLACDAAVVRVGEDRQGNALDVGRRRRTIPTVLRRALRVRDHGCRFPGCTNRFVDGHHVVPWARGGATALHNLCSLCRRHHTYVHELGFRVEAAGSGDFRFFHPDGREVPSSGVPLVPAWITSPVDDLREQHRAIGVTIDAETGMPGWDGRPPDYDQAVWCLMTGVEAPALPDAADAT